ncbi:carboxypeptidase-like regulatory domain-containing protein [bacterium]|nr:carboxypeptidase-like regulatory domain-containing protein [bacterium]
MRCVSITFFVISLMFANYAFCAEVEGSVARADNNQPVAHALVLFVSNGMEAGRTMTGDDGYFYHGSIPDGTYTIKIVYGQTVREFSNVAIPHGGRLDLKI